MEALERFPHPTGGLLANEYLTECCLGVRQSFTSPKATKTRRSLQQDSSRCQRNTEAEVCGWREQEVEEENLKLLAEGPPWGEGVQTGRRNIGLL